MRTLSSSGKSLEVSGDLETNTGIWEESNYCLSVSSFLPTTPLTSSWSRWAAGGLSVYISVYAPGWCYFFVGLCPEGWDKEGSVALNSRLGHTSTQVCVSLQSYLSF